MSGPSRLRLMAGLRLGPYEILSPLGAGGMGQVYKARDTKRNRDVALKILPEAFTVNGDRVARFRPEAQVLASLNQPNIAARSVPRIGRRLFRPARDISSDS